MNANWRDPAISKLRRLFLALKIRRHGMILNHKRGACLIREDTVPAVPQ
jgi:hypothetical protein